MDTSVRWRLSIMMFLQYMVWGAWYGVYGSYLERLGLTGLQIGFVYSLFPLGCMIAPFIGGQLADRYIATEKLLAILHVLGGVAMILLARQTSYTGIIVFMTAWAFLYAPTLALTNSITFRHLPDAEKKFGLVRVFGTLGWIAVGGLLTGVRLLWPETQGLPLLGGADSIWLSAFFSLLLGLYCISSLPYTPPAKKGDDPWAFLAAFKMLRNPSFLIFTIIAFIVATELMFYYMLTAPFLESIGVASANIPVVMTIAQAAEIGTMVALPWMLKSWGVRKTMALGILVWPIRYAIFAYGQPKGIVIAALSLHGICYVCFLVVAYIYVNSVATEDTRASAQAFITFVTLGAGMYVGSIFAGYIKDLFTVNGLVNYTAVFIVPAVLTTICAIVFFLGFKDNRAEVRAEAAEAKAG